MSDIKSTLLLVLISDPDVSALAGSRVYPMRLPQLGLLPAMTYQLISNNPVSSIDGDSGLDNVRMQITCWAKTSYQAIALSLAARRAIEKAASSLKAIMIMELDTEDPETRSYGIITDYSMWSSIAQISIFDDAGNVIKDDDGNIITS